MVARGGEADAVHLRILGGVGQLIKVRRLEAALQADSHRVGFTGNGTRCIGESPIRRAKRNYLPSSEALRVNTHRLYRGSLGVAVPPPAALDRQRVGVGRHVAKACEDGGVMQTHRDSWRSHDQRFDARGRAISACQPLATICGPDAIVGQPAPAFERDWPRFGTR